MNTNLVSASLRLVNGRYEPIVLDIVEQPSGPPTAALAQQHLRHGWFAVSERLQPLVLEPGLPIEMRGLQAQLLSLSLGWQSGACRPSQPLMIGQELVGDAAICRKQFPLSAGIDRVVFGPQASTRSTRVLEVYSFIRAKRAELIVDEQSGRLGKAVLLSLDFIGRQSVVDLAAIGWQLGFWYPTYRCITNIGSGLFLVVAELGGFVGELVSPKKRAAIVYH